MDIGKLTESELIEAGFKIHETDSGTYYTYPIGNKSFVAIDDRQNRREIWGYNNGTRMTKDEVKTKIEKIFEKPDIEESDIQEIQERNLEKTSVMSVPITPEVITTAEKGIPTIAENVTPKAFISKMHSLSKALVDIVEKQELYVVIKGKKFLKLEAWQTLGGLCQLSGMCIRAPYVEINGKRGFEALAVVVNKNGRIVSSGEAMCLDEEENWKDKPLYQLKSMAQTRALSKAYRMALSFIVVLSGYEPCPAEEVVDEEYENLS